MNAFRWNEFSSVFSLYLNRISSDFKANLEFKTQSKMVESEQMLSNVKKQLFATVIGLFYCGCCYTAKLCARQQYFLSTQPTSSF